MNDDSERKSADVCLLRQQTLLSSIWLLDKPRALISSVSLVPVCLPPPPPLERTKGPPENQQTISCICNSSIRDATHWVVHTLYWRSPPLSSSPRIHWKPMQCNVWLYMFDIIWNVSVRLVKWSHSPNHNEKIKEVLKYEKCSVQLKGVPSPWSPIQTTSCM